MKTKTSIQFGFVDVTAKADSELTVNNKQEFSYTTRLNFFGLYPLQSHFLYMTTF